MDCKNCNKELKLGSRWFIHKDSNDSWCYPLINQFSWEYKMATPNE